MACLRSIAAKPTLRENTLGNITLTVEQQFNICAFQQQVKSLSQEQAQAFLVDLYRQMIIKETMYKQLLMKELIGE